MVVKYVLAFTIWYDTGEVFQQGAIPFNDIDNCIGLYENLKARTNREKDKDVNLLTGCIMSSEGYCEALESYKV